MVTMTTQTINIIQNVGFPIAAFMLMWRFSSVTLKENTRAIRDLCIKLEHVINK